MPPSTVDPVQWLAREYYDLNGSYIEILDSPPTALGFSRMVHISRPVIIKGFHIPASLKWTNEYLVTEMGTQEISVAATPNGRADAVTEGPDGSFYFAEPYEDKMTMSGLLSKLTADGPEVHYLQSQNGNLYGAEFFQGQTDAKTTEFEPLRKDVPSDVPWASKALDRSPDAVNLWIGNEQSMTSVHSDPYENLYTVVRGAKHFTLLPPTEGRYLNGVEYHLKNGIPMRDTPPVRWSSILEPHLSGALPAESHPIHVTLLAGESLYLPAGWWHYVRQAAGVTIAVNWWYDMEMRGTSWAMLSFMRTFGPAALDFDDEQEGIRIKADEEFAIEKAKLVKQEQHAIGALHEKKYKQAEVAQKMSCTVDLDEQLPIETPPSARGTHSGPLYRARFTPVPLRCFGRYRKIHSILITEGLLQLLEADVIVETRQKDVHVAQAAAENAKIAYKEISGRDVQIHIQGSLSDEIAGGVKLSNASQRTKLDNTLDIRDAVAD